MNTQSASYGKSGVDVDAGNQFVKNIKSMVTSTARIGTNAQIGGFGGLFDLAQTGYRDPLLISTTDGVGTKLKLAQLVGIHDTIGIDLVAMNVNDLIVHGAEPLFFLDYFSTGKLNLEQAGQIVQGIVNGCKQSNCALVGGETAEMPGMYNTGEYDLAGFAVGAVERSQLLPKIDDIDQGDIVIGLASSGLHSNGFSLVRYLIEQHNINIYDKPPFPSHRNFLYEVLLQPTKIYVASLLPLIKQNIIKALAHITGGGLLENPPRILPAHLQITIDTNAWQPNPVFGWLEQLGNITQQEMFRTFNMGIGMILIVNPEQTDFIQAKLKAHGEITHILGQVETKKGTQQVVLQ